MAADVLAVGALAALREMAVAVPNEVQVIGFDGIPLGRYTVPPLSTILQDSEVTAAIITDELLRLRAGAPAPRHVILPVEFIERESTLPIKRPLL